MKTLIFARVSSREQEEGHSLDAQIQRCYEYAIQRDFKVVEQFRVIESTLTQGRPEFAKMIDFITSQKEKIAILCYSVDRLQRDFDAQYLTLQDLIKKDKAEIHYVQTNFIEHKDMDSSDKFRKNLDVLLANDYRNKISDNVKRSVRKKLEEGTILGDSPLGYFNKKRMDIKKEKVEVYLDPERASLVRQIFEEYATGMYSMVEVRLLITNAGLRTKKGNKVSVSHIENILKNTFYYGYMNYKDMLYKHVHPRLITKELFDECQRVRKGRRKTGYKRTQKPFVLKGLLKCIHCGCSYSPELKKKKYVYMRPTKSQGDCKVCHHMNETKILSQIEDVLKNMSIPKHILLDIQDELKKCSDKEHKHLVSERTQLKAKMSGVDEKLKRARDLLLDLGITKDEYNEIKAELEIERHNIDVKLQSLSKADDSFNETLGIIFELASKAHELFKSSEIEEKRRIITILFPNLKMDSEKLVFNLRKPFDLFVKGANHPDWLGWLDSNQRSRDQNPLPCRLATPQQCYNSRYVT
jgi:site-specific DNA recombinase